MCAKAAAGDKSVSALAYLEKPERHPPRPVCGVFGDEAYLKHEVLVALRHAALAGEDAELSLTVLSGETATLRDVLDDLATVAMFSTGDRVVIVEEADKFVTAHREALEDYVARPKHRGVLVLELKTFPSNTRLYKAVAAVGLIVECKAPAEAELRKWLIGRAKQQQATLDPVAAETLLERSDPDVGILDQEVKRLALLAGTGGKITPELVEKHVGNWKTLDVWKTLDAVGEGNAREAIRLVDRLIASGDDPQGILPGLAFGLRRFAAAGLLVEQSERQGRSANVGAVLSQLGVYPNIREKTERQFRQIGRARVKELYRWLLDADLAMKGAASNPARSRLVLETLIVRLSQQADPRQKSSS